LKDDGGDDDDDDNNCSENEYIFIETVKWIYINRRIAISDRNQQPYFIAMLLSEIRK
jgi:hypothetical protein